MFRKSSDVDFLKTGKVVIDADGVEVDLSAAMDANRRASIQWLYYGTGTPTLADFPGIKIGDYIVRKTDGQEWRVDA